MSGRGYTYYMAVSGEPKRILEEWRRRYQESLSGYIEWGRGLGATRVFKDFDGLPIGFSFRRDQEPVGWTKMNRSGYSRPKKNNTADQERIAQFNIPLNIDAYIIEELNLPTLISYMKDGMTLTKGLTPKGKISTFELLWTVTEGGFLGDVILRAPDYENAIPDADEFSWLPEGTRPAFPEGFKKMTEAEVNLYYAEHSVAAEKHYRESVAMLETLNVEQPEDLYAAVRAELGKLDYDLKCDVIMTPDGPSYDVTYDNTDRRIHKPLEAATQKLMTLLIEVVPDVSEPGDRARLLFPKDPGEPAVIVADDGYRRKLDVDVLKVKGFALEP